MTFLPHSDIEIDFSQDAGSEPTRITIICGNDNLQK